MPHSHSHVRTYVRTKRKNYAPSRALISVLRSGYFVLPCIFDPKDTGAQKNAARRRVSKMLKDTRPYIGFAQLCRVVQQERSKAPNESSADLTEAVKIRLARSCRGCRYDTALIWRALDATEPAHRPAPANARTLADAPLPPSSAVPTHEDAVTVLQTIRTQLSLPAAGCRPMPPADVEPVRRLERRRALRQVAALIRDFAYEVDAHESETPALETVDEELAPA